MKVPRVLGSWSEFANFLVILTTALFGFAHAPWWSIAGSTLLLSAMGWRRWSELRERAVRVGAERVFAWTFFESVANTLFFCTLAFALGWGMRAVIEW